nr:putative ORF1 [Marmot picobirnavirus]
MVLQVKQTFNLTLATNPAICWLGIGMNRHCHRKGGQTMTQNQLAYWRLKEDERANRVREAETQRHNLVSEEIGFGANKASMAHAGAAYAAVGESTRHNTAQEGITSWNNRANVIVDAVDLGGRLLWGNKGLLGSITDGFSTAGRIISMTGMGTTLGMVPRKDVRSTSTMDKTRSSQQNSKRKDRVS